MITLQQFIDKYLSKQVEYHSYSPDAKFQCVDSVNQYIVEVLNLTPVIGTNAKDFPKKINKDQFEVLENTPEFVPKQGDIVVWNGNRGGGAGHIAIVRDNEAILDFFHSFDQNWSWPLHCTLENHSYKDVTYFLRPKGKNMATMYGTPNQYDLDNHESMKVAVDVLNDVQSGKYIKKEESDRLATQAYDKGFENGKQQTNYEIDLPDAEKFEINGITIEKWNNNTKQITNYKVKS